MITNIPLSHIGVGIMLALQDLMCLALQDLMCWCWNNVGASGLFVLIVPFTHMTSGIPIISLSKIKTPYYMLFSSRNLE